MTRGALAQAPIRPCPACTQSEFAAASPVPDVVDTYRCLTCGLIVADHLHRVDAGYELLNEDAYAHSVGATRARQAEDVIAAVRVLGVPGPRRWVDVGCGPGTLLTQVREAGFETVGLEPDPIAAEQAQQVVEGLELHRSILVDGLLEDDSSAVVSTMDVLEHIPADELDDFVERVRRTLVPGGIWVIKLPTSEGPYFRLANVARRLSRRLSDRVLRRLWQTEYAYPHTVYFDRRSLGVFLGSAGFEVETASYPQEVALSTALSRLRMDPTVPTSQALMALPAAIAINAFERAYGKTDALLVLARRR